MSSQERHVPSRPPQACVSLGSRASVLFSLAPIQQPHWCSSSGLQPRKRIQVFRQRATICSAPTLVISQEFSLSIKPRFVCRSWTRGYTDRSPFWCRTSEPYEKRDTTQVVMFVGTRTSRSVNADGSMAVHSLLGIRRQHYTGKKTTPLRDIRSLI